jgi:two-component system, OmpR family, KDP operon response regulator KdpE
LKALLISDDVLTKQFLDEALQGRGHELVSADDPSSAWRLARRDVDLVLYDLGKGDEAQWEQLAAWRQATELPFIVLGSGDNQNSAVRALQLGADDYVARPLHAAELLARLQARLRRARMVSAHIPAVREPRSEGSLVLDWQAMQARIRGRRVDLTPTEYKVLEALLRSKGQPVSREELIRQVWGGDRRGLTTNLNLYIWHLRQKLEADPACPRLILTRWGMGYSLQEEEE